MIQILKDFLNSSLVLKKAANTQKAYQRDLIAFNEYLTKYNMSLDKLNDLGVQQYINQIKTQDGKPASPATKNRVFASIRTFCNWSNQREAIEDITLPKLPPISKQPAKGLSREEVTALRLSVANDHNPNKLRNLAIVDLLLYSGIRVNELVSLNRDNIKYHKGTYIIKILETKNDEVRTVYIHSKQFKYIKRYLDSRTDNEEALFLSGRGRISIRMVQTILNKYGIYPHLLRHTFCSTLARNNVDIFTIASMSGHKDINVLRRYCLPTEQEMADTVAKAFDF